MNNWFIRAGRVLIPALLLSAVGLTGCIEIVEEITVHPGRNGTVSYRVESTKTGGLIGGLMSFFDATAQEIVISEAGKLIRELESQKGISNIRYNLRGSATSYYLSFDFDDCTNLNKAIYSVGGSRKTPLAPSYLRIGKSRTRKFNFSPLLQRYLKKEEIGLPPALITDNITYRSIIRTPEDIRSVRNASLDDARAVSQRFNLSDVLEGKVNTGMVVRY